VELTQKALENAGVGTALISCKSYHPFDVRRALRSALDQLGSPEKFIKPGDTILLKPNMLSAKEPEYAVTTHPEIIAAVGEVVLDCGGKIVLGDSPAGMARNLAKYWHKTGIAEAARHLSVTPVSFENAGIKSFSAPGGFVNISRTALEVDGIINLPKLKTHQLTLMTGAVKNMFGTVPGFRKGYLHSLAPEPLPFSRFVVAVFREVIPRLTIMDAVQCMEGNGPSSGQPRHVGALLVSADALALDSVAARIIGMDAKHLPVFRAAYEAGLWEWDNERNKVLGETLDRYLVPDFKLPDVSRLERIPSFVKHNLKRLIWIRPRCNPAVCNACELCVDSCPQQAMSMVKNYPQIDHKKCIKCGCCDEVCPDNAIVQQMSILARLLS
jgi:uncharacterized protein (DUF362 family)/Pyruvate/2-oxoacid:ferredoxin oxidoreductase delta subunit